MQFSKLFSFIAVALLVSVVFAGLATTPAAAQTEPTAAPGWKYRADLQNTGMYDDGGVRPNNVLKWSFTTGGAIFSSPAVVNGVVYVGSEDNNVYAINALTGVKLWNYTTGGYLRSSPAVVNDVVYIASSDRNIYAINAANGNKLWNFTTGWLTYSSPAVVNLSLIHI